RLGVRPARAPRLWGGEPVAGSEQPDMRSAEVERIAERLALGGDDVPPHLARGAYGAEGQDLGDRDDQQGAGLVADARKPGVVPDFAEKVGVLPHDAGGVAIDEPTEIFATQRILSLKLEPDKPGIGLANFAV